MSQPKINEEKLIQAGIVLAKQHGLGFTVRHLCAKSKVNLGLFHYYFQNKDNFDKVLLRTVYNQMLDQITLQVSDEATPRENIEKILLGFHAFVRDNRMFFSSLLGDCLSGNKKLLQFFTQNFTQHLSLISHELKRASLTTRAEGQPLPGMLALLAWPVVMPQILMGLLERIGTKAFPLQNVLLTQTLENDRQFRARIQIVLDGIFGEHA